RVCVLVDLIIIHTIATTHIRAQHVCSIDLLSVFFSLIPRPPKYTLFPYTTLFRSNLFKPALMEAAGLNYYSVGRPDVVGERAVRSEEHTSELQSRENIVCRLLLETKNNSINLTQTQHIHSSNP